MKKTISILLIVTILISSVTFAAFKVPTDITPNENVKIDSGVQTTTQKILGVMQWIGYAIAVGMIIFCGIKYVMSGAGEKAKVKETLVPILIGAILIAGAVTIANALVSIGGTTTSTTAAE